MTKEEELVLEFLKLLNKESHSTDIPSQINSRTNLTFNFIHKILTTKIPEEKLKFKESPFAHRLKLIIRDVYWYNSEELKYIRTTPRLTKRDSILKEIHKFLNYDSYLPPGRPISIELQILKDFITLFPLSQRELSFGMFMLKYSIDKELQDLFFDEKKKDEDILKLLKERYPKEDEEELEKYIESVRKFIEIENNPLTWISPVFSLESFKNMRKIYKHQNIVRMIQNLKINPKTYRENFKMNPIKTMKDTFKRTGYLVVPFRIIEPSSSDILYETGITKKQPKGGFPLFYFNSQSQNFEDALLELLYSPSVDWLGLLTVDPLGIDDVSILKLFGGRIPKDLYNQDPLSFLQLVIKYEKNQKDFFYGLIKLSNPDVHLDFLGESLGEIYSISQKSLAETLGKIFSVVIFEKLKPYVQEVFVEILKYIGFEIKPWKTPEKFIRMIMQDINEEIRGWLLTRYDIRGKWTDFVIENKVPLTRFVNKVKLRFLAKLFENIRDMEQSMFVNEVIHREWSDEIINQFNEILGGEFFTPSNVKLVEGLIDIENEDFKKKVEEFESLLGNNKELTEKLKKAIEVLEKEDVGHEEVEEVLKELGFDKKVDNLLTDKRRREEKDIKDKGIINKDKKSER